MHLTRIRSKIKKRIPLALRCQLGMTKAPALKSEIQELDVLCGEKISIGNDIYYLIEVINDCEQPVQIIGELPNPTERALLGSECKNKGLSKEYAKVLMDAIVRYRFPHLACGYLQMKYSQDKRQFFHLQHRNLAMEDANINDNMKKNYPSGV